TKDSLTIRSAAASAQIRGWESRPQELLFRGPGERQNLRAQNLTAFFQLLVGVDEETFLYHLRRGDYGAWLRAVIKDGELAAEVETLRNSDRTASEIRHLFKVGIDSLYAIQVKA